MTATLPLVPEALHGQFMTPEAYLTMERQGNRESHGKYELINQTLRFMAGASTAHNDIAANLTTLLKLATWQYDLFAHVAQSDMRVVSFLTYKNYFYPDIVFTMGERVYHDQKKDVLINPTMLIEVLSDDTKVFDRGDKYGSYQQIDSLQEYLLVDQYTRCIEQFYKNEEGEWVKGDVAKSGILMLKSIDFGLNLNQVYRGLPF